MRIRFNIILCAFLSLLCFSISCSEGVMEDPPITVCDTLQVSYSNDINPIVRNSCRISGCHVEGFEHGNFYDFEEIKESALSGRLWLFTAVLRSMPPSSEISSEDLKKIRCWIDDGAPDN